MMYALLTRLSGAHLRVATPQVGPDRDLWRNRIFYAGDEVEQDTNISYTRTTLMVNTLITLNTTGGQSVKVEQVNTTTSVNCAFTFTYYIRKGLVNKLVCGVYTIYISSLTHDIPSLPSPPVSLPVTTTEQSYFFARRYVRGRVRFNVRVYHLLLNGLYTSNDPFPALTLVVYVYAFFFFFLLFFFLFF